LKVFKHSKVGITLELFQYTNLCPSTKENEIQGIILKSEFSQPVAPAH